MIMINFVTYRTHFASSRSKIQLKDWIGLNRIKVGLDRNIINSLTKMDRLTGLINFGWIWTRLYKNGQDLRGINRIRQDWTSILAILTEWQTQSIDTETTKKVPPRRLRLAEAAQS